MLDHLLVRISSGSDQSKPLPQSTQVSPARGGVGGRGGSYDGVNKLCSGQLEIMVMMENI